MSAPPGAPRHRAAFLLLLALLVRGPSYSAASDVDETCSPTEVCTPDQLTGVALFCDYAVGPEAGGRCQMCGDGDSLTFCPVFKPELAVFGSKDCIEKCAFRNCVESCPDGDFCSHFNFGAQSSCQNCQALIVHSDECKSGDFRFPKEGVAACEGTCPARTCTKARNCLVTHPSTKFFCNLEDPEEGEEAQGTCAPCAGLAALEECATRSTFALGRQQCEDICAQTIVTSCAGSAPEEVQGLVFDWDELDGAAAASNAACADLPTRHFCGDGGVCRVCPGATSGLLGFHAEDCFETDPNFQGQWGLTTNGTDQSCADLCHTDCYENRTAIVEVAGLNITWGLKNNFPMQKTQYRDATGPLVDCKMGGLGECQTKETEGFMCLISRGARKFSDKVLNCEIAGGVGAVMYNNQAGAGFVQAGVGDVPSEISITSISMEDGLKLLDEGLGMELRLHVEFLGDICKTGCSDRLACPLEASFCDYQLENGTQGHCDECLEDEDEQRTECFMSGLPVKGAQACADTCGSTFLAPSNCKICGKAVSGDLLQSAATDDPRCNFCPGPDGSNGLQRENFENVIPFIGKDATCQKVDQFFQNYYVAESNPNCQLALGFNYICDCEGPGYAGADTQAKRNALVWVPRTSAILSLLGSSSIIVDVFRDKVKRKTPYGELMIAMSMFDFLGSAGYSLTTLPIPSKYGVEGAKGNDATCTAQGFFIQMGTIAAFINVSLAAYYFCVIQLGWGDTRIMDIRHWFFLVPIVVGMTFACAGLYNFETEKSYYEMLFVWCNNSAAWWPDIPVVLAIIATTCTMGSVYYDVWKTEQASKRSANNNINNSTAPQTMSSKIFWQSLWYLSSFYVTWVPYLVLQFVWALGEGYSSYGWILLATTLVPLQGFWNAIVYFRRRAKKRANELFSIFRSRTSTARTGGTAQNAAGQTEGSTKKTADVSYGASAASRGPSAVSHGVSTGGGEA